MPGAWPREKPEGERPSTPPGATKPMNKCKWLPPTEGDQGQRFEVTYLDPETKERKPFGWCQSIEVARIMVKSIGLHPSLTDGRIEDRQPEKDKPRPA